LFFPIKKIEKEAYTRKRPMYANGRRPCMDSRNLMQSISYTTEAWRKLPMTKKVYHNGYSEVRDDGLKSMANSHDNRYEEVEETLIQ
jgi:hypothetical protein